MIKNENLIKRTLLWQMFGKQKKDLTLDELREYNRERKKQSRTSETIKQSESEYMTKWKQEHPDYHTKYMREWRLKRKCQNKTN